MPEGRIVELDTGLEVVRVDSKSAQILINELNHYAFLYSQDGPIKIELKNNKTKRWNRLATVHPCTTNAIHE